MRRMVPELSACVTQTPKNEVELLHKSIKI